MGPLDLFYKYVPTRAVSATVLPYKEAMEDALVTAVNSSQLRHDAPWSPDIPKELLRSMPSLPGRLQFTFPWSRPQPVNPKQDVVWIFDNTAFLAQNQTGSSKKSDRHDEDVSMKSITSDLLPTPVWQVEYVVAYFSRQTSRDASHVVESIARIVGLNLSEVGPLRDLLDTLPIKRRLEPFLNPILPKRTVRVNINDTESQTLGPSSVSGISSAVHDIHFEAQPGSQAITIADHDWPPMWSSPGHTIFAEPTGWGVISDIDDTIKITNTLSLPGILKSTFLEEPQAVPGMPELYSDLQTILSDPAFFYISASPYNLYPFLRTFRKHHYPDGTIILREASWQNLGGLITSLHSSVKEYKINRLEKIRKWFPGRKFICVGDSTESDAESYGEMGRRYPGWIRGIYIRRVRDPEGGVLPGTLAEEERNSEGRFERAFRGVEGGMWRVFEDPDEVREHIQGLI